SAAIVQGVYKRGLDGNASSQKALEYADECRNRADRAWAMVQEFTG
ncbi:MAG TPA: phosphotransferase family protein, partial [Porticoccaceae bacterium]|nr:phosphotransferase family protein [Porticoccaceae bacterium]